MASFFGGPHRAAAVAKAAETSKTRPDQHRAKIRDAHCTIALQSLLKHEHSPACSPRKGVYVKGQVRQECLPWSHLIELMLFEQRSANRDVPCLRGWRRKARGKRLELTWPLGATRKR